MRKFTTVVSIPPEFIQVWEAAWSKQPTEDDPFLLEFENNAQAINFRQQLYSARQACQKEMYLGSNQWSRLEIGLRGDDNNHLFIKLPKWLAVVQKTLEREGVPLQPVVVEPQADVIKTDHMGDAIRDLFIEKKH